MCDAGEAFGLADKNLVGEASCAHPPQTETLDAIASLIKLEGFRNEISCIAIMVTKSKMRFRVPTPCHLAIRLFLMMPVSRRIEIPFGRLVTVASIARIRLSNEVITDRKLDMAEDRCGFRELAFQ